MLDWLDWLWICGCVSLMSDMGGIPQYNTKGHPTSTTKLLYMKIADLHILLYCSSEQNPHDVAIAWWIGPLRFACNGSDYPRTQSFPQNHVDLSSHPVHTQNIPERWLSIIATVGHVCRFHYPRYKYQIRMQARLTEPCSKLHYWKANSLWIPPPWNLQSLRLLISNNLTAGLEAQGMLQPWWGCQTKLFPPVMLVYDSLWRLWYMTFVVWDRRRSLLLSWFPDFLISSATDWPMNRTGVSHLRSKETLHVPLYSAQLVVVPSVVDPWRHACFCHLLQLVGHRSRDFRSVNDTPFTLPECYAFIPLCNTIKRQHDAGTSLWEYSRSPV